jgi:hypothetical protein
MKICSLGKSKSKNIKPIFVIKLSKKAKVEDIIRTNDYVNGSPLGKDYHVLVIKSSTNIDIEFELYNVKDISITDFELFKEEIKTLNK